MKIVAAILGYGLIIFAFIYIIGSVIQIIKHIRSRQRAARENKTEGKENNEQ